MKRLIPVILTLLLFSCTGGDEDRYAAPARVIPLYSHIANGNVPDSDSIELKAFMSTVSDLPFSHDVLRSWAESKPVAVFTPDVDSVYTDSMYVPRILGGILGRAESAGIELPDRRYATVVYGRPESMLFVDSVMLIALNHYLGYQYPGYSHWPEYMRRTKTPQALPYDIAEALVATSYPYLLEGEEATLLSRMIYEGALAYIKCNLVPDSDIAAALGYSKEQMKWLEENENDIWKSIVQRQLLYDTSSTTVDRLIAPSPDVNIVSPIAPGRVGRYIGYKIVESYLSGNPSVSMSEMLSPDFYKGNSVLLASRYMR